MRAKPNLPEDREVLQELLDLPPQITQADLAEYTRLEEVYDLARGDFESVRDQLVEMLVLGFPIRPGGWTAQLRDGIPIVGPVDIG